MTRRFATLRACMRELDGILTSQGVKPSVTDRHRIIRALRPCIEQIGAEERKARRRYWIPVVALVAGYVAFSLFLDYAKAPEYVPSLDTPLSGQEKQHVPLSPANEPPSGRPSVTTSDSGGELGKQWTLSVYAARYHGRTAANGERYDHFDMTCAANDYPLGSTLAVTYGSRIIVVEVTDRLDKELGKERIDLSGGAMAALCDSYYIVANGRYVIDQAATDATAPLLRGATVVWREDPAREGR